MKLVKNLDNKELYLELMDILKIGNQAVQKAKAENKALGIPEFFVKNGKLFYQLLNGEITEERPETLKN